MDARRPPRCANRPQGFTLLEVLAAIALLAIAFAVGLGALGKAAQNAGRAAALNAAVERAQSLFAEQGLDAPLHAGTRQGKFADGMAWTLEIRALPASPTAPEGQAGVVPQLPGPAPAQAAVQLYQLDIAVQYGAGRTLRLSTQRAQTAPSEAGP